MVWCADGAVLPTEEMSLARDMAVPIDCGTNLADILSNALPPDKRGHEKDKPLSDSSVSFSFIFIDKRTFTKKICLINANLDLCELFVL